MLAIKSLVFKSYNLAVPIKLFCNATLKGLRAVLDQKHNEH